ncbi:hypothetical protein CHS0354_011972 [Potamilus streckersoni]|uniref:AXH domain-containing protein n=1 Tax=Potamilus streckersoni TaxID=2493646 RepID=A0AAE0TFG3_9BIVA|nr:hypothetical protein CHS0354_011972 [Potamilus streckersoni]
MTGSSGTGGVNGNLNWLADVAASQGQTAATTTGRSSQGSSTHTSEEGMLISRLGVGGGAGIGSGPVHEGNGRSIVTGTAGVSVATQGNMGSIFRPQLTISDPTQRLATGGPYATIYTTATGSSLGPFYTSHTQAGSAISPYTTFYQPYPSYTGGAGAAVLSGHYPQIESYSAVLQSMGSHAAQSQLPRSPFSSGPPAHQYPLLNTTHHHSVTPTTTNSPGPIYSSRDEIESKTRRELEMDPQRRYSTGFLKEEKGRHFSPPAGFLGTHRSSVSSGLQDLPKQKKDHVGSPTQDFYKLPSGKEGSLKHRILSDVASSSAQQSLFVHPDELSPKRTKPDTNLGYSLQGHSPQPPETKDPTLSVHGDISDPNQIGAFTDIASSNPHYHPPHFFKGSIIQLANGDLKRVEDLKTEDFVHSADTSADLKIDSSTVVKIDENYETGTAQLGFVVGEHRVKVTVDAALEHPFFVFGQGWSSCDPQRTFNLYQLECQKLIVGDVCISLTHKEVTAHAAEISQQQRELSPQETKHLEVSPSEDKGRNWENRQNNGTSFAIPDSHFSMKTQEHKCPIDNKLESIPPRKRRWSGREDVDTPSSDWPEVRRENSEEK